MYLLPSPSEMAAMLPRAIDAAVVDGVPGAAGAAEVRGGRRND